MKFFVALAIAAAATCASAQERKCGSINPPADLKFETTTEPTSDIVERAARRARYTVDTVCMHELITLADACYERSIC